MLTSCVGVHLTCTSKYNSITRIVHFRDDDVTRSILAITIGTRSIRNRVSRSPTISESESNIYRRRSPHSKNKKQPPRGDSIESEEKYGGVGLMLRGRDARAADGGRGMAWVGGHRGRARRCKGMTGKRGWRETGSRGAPWVMLRDETPRGVIEQRGEERRKEGGGSRRAGLKERERRGRERG